MKFQLDNGASVNIVLANTVTHIICRPTETRLIMWNGAKVCPHRETIPQTTNPKNDGYFAMKFVIVRQGLFPILFRESLKRLNLISFIIFLISLNITFDEKWKLPGMGPWGLRKEVFLCPVGERFERELKFLMDMDVLTPRDSYGNIRRAAHLCLRQSSRQDAENYHISMPSGARYFTKIDFELLDGIWHIFDLS